MIPTLRNCFQRIKRSNHFFEQQRRNLLVFGIESSCDDTGCAVVDYKGNILGESRFSQAQQHWDNGGIKPDFAATIHEANIGKAAEQAVNQANITIKDVDAVAVTVEPGIACCLRVGLEHAKNLCTLYQKPLMPIHHMQAHALTYRMIEKIELPFLVLLISGGHSIIVLAKSVDEFFILGDALDSAPGQVLDKGARRLKLNHIPKFRKYNGGALVEQASLLGDPFAFDFDMQLGHQADCNFTWSGLLMKLKVHLAKEQERHGTKPDQILPSVYDLSASFQYNLTKHLCQRLQRAMKFVEIKDLIPQEKKYLVVSGGVASNQFIRSMLQYLCDELDYKLCIPPPKLCTDNGAMIAWNAIERLNINIAPVSPNNLDSVLVERRVPIGKDISKQVAAEHVKCEWVKLDKMLKEKRKNSENQEQDVAVKN